MTEREPDVACVSYDGVRPMKSRPIILWLDRSALGAFVVIWVVTLCLWAFSASHYFGGWILLSRPTQPTGVTHRLVTSVANGSLSVQWVSIDFSDPSVRVSEKGEDAFTLLRSSPRFHFTVAEVGRAWIDTSVATCGFDYQTKKQLTFPDASETWRLLRMPLLTPAVLATPFAVTVLIRQRRRHFAKTHHCCSACGYDLRASHDRCPECGTPIAVPQTTVPPTGIAAG